MKIKFRGIYTRPAEIEYTKNKDGLYDIKLNVYDFLDLTADPNFYMIYSDGELDSIIEENYK